jgi:flavin-dependent dehydrogenase
MQTEKVDVLVIGAGPAGTVAASIVNKAGYTVKIVEKQLFPRFVIGESLLPRCMEAFTEAGFIDAITEKGFQQKGGAKFVKNGKICDYSFSDQYTTGWNWTWQVPRAAFDKTLADTVEKMGVEVAYEKTVTGISFQGSDSLTRIQGKNGEETEISARFIIDGSGYGRVIPRLFNLERPSDQPSRKAIFAHVVDLKRSMADEPNRITIVVHEPGVWIWIIPFSDGITSLGFVGDPAFFNRYAGDQTAQFRAMIASEPYLSERFKDVELIFEPRVLQAWSSTTDRFFGEGFVLTGNVTEFLDPIFSSGVTLATVSSQMAAKLVIEKLQGKQVDWDASYMQPMMQGIDTFRSYVTAWYDGVLDRIFFSEDQDELIKSQICSVLAGYVWDKANPYVRNHKNALIKLSAIIEFRDNLKKINPE